MTVVVAGVDVGNHTTEIVLARVGADAVEQVAHGEGPTRGRKGSRESLQGAAALLHKLEVESGVKADELLWRRCVRSTPRPPRCHHRRHRPHPCKACGRSTPAHRRAPASGWADIARSAVCVAR